MTNIVSCIVSFFVVFFIGCVIALIVTVLSMEKEDAEEAEYFTLENLEILDALTEGDDEG